MKNILYFLPFLGLLIFSCSDDPDPVGGCNVDNVFEMPWLEDRIEELEKSDIGKKYAYLHSGRYGSQTVFVFGSCCPYCYMAPPLVYDCGGNELGQLGIDGIDWEGIEDQKVIWKSSENSCNI